MPTDGALVTGDLLTIWAQLRPASPALTVNSADGNRRTFSYRELNELISKVATGLILQGIGKGDRVAFMTSNDAGLEGVAAYLGAHRAGAVALPVNGKLTAHEAAPLAAQAQIAALVYEPRFRTQAQAIAAAVNPKPLLFEAGNHPRPGALDFTALTSPGSRPDHFPALTPDDHADWLFTSGTTGMPRCVMLSHANCMAHAHMFPAAMGMRQDDTVLTTFPFFTSSGVHSSLLTTLGVGAHYVMSATTQADALISEIQETGATIVGAVPSIFAYMSRSTALEGADLSGVRLAFHGGAPVSPHQVRTFRQLFPRAEIINIFGQTESGNPGTYLPGQYAEVKAGSIGRDGMPGVQVRVVDVNTGEVLHGRPGIGELCLKSAAVMVGYYNDPEATAATVVDGWLHTGDLVRVDEDGFMFVHDRMKDMVCRGGNNIASLEVENVLSTHPSVAEAAVVPKPHPDLGEDLLAFVVLNPGHDLDVDAIRTHAATLLADYKIPRDIRAIDELPRNPTGKILKRLLRSIPVNS